MLRHLSVNIRYIVLMVLLGAIAFGVNWSAYELARANTIQFVPYGTIGPKA